MTMTTNARRTRNKTAGVSAGGDVADIPRGGVARDGEILSPAKRIKKKMPTAATKLAA
jgi:hypothetical protein